MILQKATDKAGTRTRYCIIYSKSIFKLLRVQSVQGMQD